MPIPVNYSVDKGVGYADLKNKSQFRKPKVIMSKLGVIQSGFDLSVNAVVNCAPPELAAILTVSSNVNTKRHTLTTLNGNLASDDGLTLSWARLMDFITPPVPNYDQAEEDVAAIFGGDPLLWKFNGVEFFYETDTHVAMRVPVPATDGRDKLPKYTGSASMYSYDPETCILTQALTLSTSVIMNPSFFNGATVASTLIAGTVDAESILELIAIPGGGVEPTYEVGKEFLINAADEYLNKTSVPFEVGL